jgi:hypothetical protein
MSGEDERGSTTGVPEGWISVPVRQNGRTMCCPIARTISSGINCLVLGDGMMG